jgi:ER-derived vesicles protein
MGYRPANPDDPIEKLRMFSKQVEDQVEIISQPLRPHLPAIGRFLIVVTFLEDALRILTQWGDQLWYLQQCVFGLWVLLAMNLSTTHNRHRHIPWGLSHLFLLINVCVCASSKFARRESDEDVKAMLAGSSAVILQRYIEYAVGCLLGVVIIQGFGYGLIFDLTFFLRNLSVIGGLVMVFSDSMVSRRKHFAGIPTVSETDRKK